MNTAFAATANDGVLTGPIRAPRNSARHLGAGSIHDDATAQKLGFRGGTVAGSLHMEQFPPLLAQALGEHWWQTGGLSLYFKYATTDGEPVQAHARLPLQHDRADQRVEVWMDDANGNRVCDGTASVGAPDAASALHNRIASARAPGELRILAALRVGATTARVPTRITEAALGNRLAVVTEPLPAYTDGSLWGHKIATPALQVQIMRPAEQPLLQRGADFGVGLFGAIELQAINGPVFVEYDYEVRATVLALGDTPKTEYFWYESILSDPQTGQDVMSMLMMLRFMKASSTRWQ